MFYNWRIKLSKNFPRNHAVPGLFFKNCFGDEGDNIYQDNPQPKRFPTLQKSIAKIYYQAHQFIIRSLKNALINRVLILTSTGHVKSAQFRADSGKSTLRKFSDDAKILFYEINSAPNTKSLRKFSGDAKILFYEINSAPNTKSQDRCHL